MSVLTFLSDYGQLDEFVGVCHGVIARLAPDVRVIDLTHGIPRHDVRAGALVLRGSLPYTPQGVHLAVVDPDVGGAVSQARFATTFADVEPGELLVYEDAQRNLALAVNRGSALGELGLSRDAELRLRPLAR